MEGIPVEDLTSSIDDITADGGVLDTLLLEADTFATAGVLGLIADVFNANPPATVELAPIESECIILPIVPQI